MKGLGSNAKKQYNDPAEMHQQELTPCTKVVCERIGVLDLAMRRQHLNMSTEHWHSQRSLALRCRFEIPSEADNLESQVLPGHDVLQYRHEHRRRGGNLGIQTMMTVDQ